MKRQNRGAAMIEYVVVAAALSAALMTPLNDDYKPSPTGKNVVVRLVDAIKKNQSSYENATALTVVDL